MPMPAYMWINDGDIEGGCTVADREGSIEVLEFHHEVRIPTDPDTGALTATRKHEPFVITKEFDAATPVLNKACASGKTLVSVKLSWYRINDQGKEEEYFRHILFNVKIVSVKPIIKDIKEKAKEKYGHLEEVAMRYAKIQWEYLDGNISTQDVWTERH